jgi:hypothetical protein
MEATFLIVLVEFCAAVVTDLRRLMFTDSDPACPPQPVFRLDGHAVTVMELLRALGGATVIAGSGVRIKLEGPGLDGVLLELAACIARRSGAWTSFDEAVKKRFGERDWAGFCHGIATLPDKAEQERLLALFREVLEIDLTIILIAKLMQTDAAAEFSRATNDDKGGVFRTLVALSGEDNSVMEIAVSWCELLDTYYRNRAGTAVARVAGYLAQLD